MASSNSRPPLPPIDFKALAAALLGRIGQLVPQWLPGGRRSGLEWVCGSLSGGEGGSFSVCMEGQRAGRWGEFAGDERGGDLISLYAAIHELTPGQAALQLARAEGLESVAGIVAGAGPGTAPPPPRPPAPPSGPSRDRERWTAQPMAPPHAPAPTLWHFERQQADILHRACYTVDGHVLGHVVRFRTSDGGKETLPYTWCRSERDGSEKWHWKFWEEPRPLYYPGGRHPGDRTVVVVEGEIKAEVLQRLLDAGAPGVYCVASWPGGSKSWRKASWNWLAGSTVLLWPDCDSKRVDLTKAERDACAGDADALAEARAAKPYLPADKQPGKAAMLGIGALLRDEHGCTASMLPCEPPGVLPDGWDARDAIEVDGWDFDRVLSHFAAAVRMLEPAPVPASTSSAGAAAKKIDLPADAPNDSDGGRIPWWLRPYFDADKGRWLVSRKLVIAALRNDENLSGVLGVNLLSNNIDAKRAWPWPHAKAGPVTGAVDLLLGSYLSETYGLPSVNRAALNEAIETVAHETPFHPVRDYLQSCEHDGKPRVDKWLIYVMGETPESLGPAMTEYLSLVGRFWLLGMVNRVMDPGCKFDYCPVLEGPGGLGKSTLVEVLAGSAWFSNTHFEVGRGKEGQEQVQGLWLYEIAELTTFGKAEINIIKAFISAKVDRYRPSYGRVVESYARQCVLVGTTNESTYLRDRSGNRRFWPIPVRHRLNNPWIEKHRNQLMAEAFARYRQGERFTPTPAEEARLFVPMQESRLVETAVLSELLHVLTRSPAAAGIGAVVNELTEFVTMSQLTTALGVDAAKSNPGLESQIRSWMEHEGWERKKRMVNTVRAWGYERPKDWPPRETDEPAAPLQRQAMHEGADDEPF
jgi:hypothetical protein